MIKAETEKGVCKLSIEGEMTIYTALEHKGQLIEPLGSCAEMEINLSKVSEIDTAGFQLLVLAKKEALREKKKLRLVEHSPATLEILELYNMAGFFGDPVVFPSKA